jgi:hypothetical protein
MAIVQISRITNRKGLTEDLPQLDGAEFGWCVDSRRLFIGNGTLAEGAPIIGNTEILTEFSDITVLSDYTYEDIAVGYAAQTGPTPSDPVVRTVQAKLDDQACVRDFGATGDGVTDDTAAINRALFQLYCVETNTQVRRSLFFPAGTYRITGTIIIPTFAKLVGEGQQCTIISLQSPAAYVARFGDSRQQVGANLGFNALLPQDIEISSMTFSSTVATDIFQIEAATQCWFSSVGFNGPYLVSDIQDPGFQPNGADNYAAVRIASTVSAVTSQITFDRCTFSNITRGITTNVNNVDYPTRGITVSNSGFYTMYQGIVLGTGATVVGGGATGFRAVHNIFDSIFAEGLIYQAVNLNASAYNAFYDVGNSIGTGTPTSAVIAFGNDNNISVGDMFERTDTQTLLYPRISFSGGTTTTGMGLQLGRYYRDRGRTLLLDNVGSVQTLISLNANQAPALSMNYTIIKGNSTRHGVMMITSSRADDSSLDTRYTDDYTESGDVGVTLAATQTDQPGTDSDIIRVTYFSSASGPLATITYSINQLG